VESPGVDEARDATRRTRLANERTYLAWWRTGLTNFAVSLAAGKLVPELSSGAAWPRAASMRLSSRAPDSSSQRLE